MDKHEHSKRAPAALALLMLTTACTCSSWADIPKAANPGNAATALAPEKPNGSGVEVRYRTPAIAIQGQTNTIELSLSDVTDAAGASVRFSADPSLTLLISTAPVRLNANQTTTLQIPVVPNDEGMAYLNVFTTQYGITSATAVPVRTGTNPLSMKPAGTLKETSTGDKLIIMPVK